jgi:predicted ribosomally synthesized peptide with SipW-like signal peptide
LHKRKWTKVALALSACLFVLWWALGTGATLAWFSDRDTVRNEFQIGLLKMDVSYRNDIVTEYTPLQGATKAFNDEALYEPGYTQVVYLKIDNLGDVAFNYKVAVTVEKYINGENAWGEEIYLPNYLRYGVVFGETEAEVQQMVKDRLSSKNHAPNDWGMLGTWSEISPYTFDVTETSHYAALIIYMPEEVGNAANYRGAVEPKVELGIKVYAQQADAPMQ